MTDSQKLDKLISVVSTLQDGMHSMQGSITSMQADITSMQGSITSMQADITSMQGSITSMQADITSMQDHIKSMDERLSVIELKQELTAKKLEDLRLDVKISERDIRRDIHKLNDQTETVIEVLKQHQMIPA